MMNENGVAFAYQQGSARSATPIGQVVALYDTILRDFRRAQEAIQNKNVETRVFELNHALTVIAHLQSVLDHERGGEAAKRFARFYDVTRGMLLEANVIGSRELLQKLADLYGSVRQAWKEIENKAPSVGSPAEAVAAVAKSPAIQQISPPTSEPATPSRSSWSA